MLWHKYKFVDEFKNGIKNLSQFEGFKDSKEYISKLKLIIQKITENEEKYKRLKVAEIKKLEEELEEAIIKIDSEKENKFNFIRFWQLLAYLVVGGEAIFLIAGLITTGDFESILAGFLGCILIDLPLGGVWFLVYSIVESQRNKKQIYFEKTKKDRKQAIKYQLTLDKQKTENKYTNIILKEKNEIIEQILGPYENGF